MQGVIAFRKDGIISTKLLKSSEFFTIFKRINSFDNSCFVESVSLGLLKIVTSNHLSDSLALSKSSMKSISGLPSVTEDWMEVNTSELNAKFQ